MSFSKRWKISCFINGFGKLPAQYASITDPVERIIFLHKHFGKVGTEILYAQQSVQRTATPFGWLSRIDNFIINLIDWRV